MARILLGVTGGIAAYKALELARLATKAGHGVRVLMTPTAERFVGAASFEGIIGAPVLVDEFERDPLRGTFPGDEPPAHDPIGHLALAANADAFVVAPASANTLAKLAAGICDSLLATSFLACTAPRAVAPAMNDRMYADAATQANLATLRERGVRVIDPDEGALASRGEHGVGRLPDPARLLAEVEAMLPAAQGSWDGLRVLVTAGGTREPIDPVRFIGNRSSGRMGLALAEAAAKRGAEVTLIAANVSRPLPAAIEAVRVETTADLARAVGERFPHCHVLLMAAAPADFRPAETTATKISRTGAAPELHLEPTEDVLAGVARTPPRRPDADRLRRGDRRRRDRPRAAKARPQGRRRDRVQRRFALGHRLRLRAQRGHGDRARRRAARPPGQQGGDRGGDPRPGGGATGRRRKRDLGGS